VLGIELSNSTPLRQKLREDLTENLLVSGVPVVLAVVAFAVLFSLGVPFIALFGCVLAIGVFVPQIYEQYWPSTRSRGFRVGWTVLMALLTTAIILVVYDAMLPFMSHQYSAIVAAVITPIAQYSIAILVAGRRQPT